MAGNSTVLARSFKLPIVYCQSAHEHKTEEECEKRRKFMSHKIPFWSEKLTCLIGIKLLSL